MRQVGCALISPMREGDEMVSDYASRNNAVKLEGPRYVIDIKSAAYPDALRELQSPPQKLYVVGNPHILRSGLSIVGARKATPYGKSCAKRFAALAASRGITVVSGGAKGCDSAAHVGALDEKGKTVAVLGGGCDCLYPLENAPLFQRIVDSGGSVISEHEWGFPAKPYTFRARNRIIAGLSEAALIVEAGIPSGTFSTADEALQLGKEVLVVPGAITAPNSQGCNRLLYQGALPVVDDESFVELLVSLYPQYMKSSGYSSYASSQVGSCGDMGLLMEDPLVRAIVAEPMDSESIYALAAQYCGQESPSLWAASRIEDAQDAGLISRYPDGSYGPLL